jgi:hypothetical protein
MTKLSLTILISIPFFRKKLFGLWISYLLVKYPLLLDTVDVDLMAFGKSIGADVVYVYLFSGFIVEFQR